MAHFQPNQTKKWFVFVLIFLFHFWIIKVRAQFHESDGRIEGTEPIKIIIRFILYRIKHIHSCQVHRMNRIPSSVLNGQNGQKNPFIQYVLFFRHLQIITSWWCVYTVALRIHCQNKKAKSLNNGRSVKTSAYINSSCVFFAVWIIVKLYFFDPGKFKIVVVLVSIIKYYLRQR